MLVLFVIIETFVKLMINVTSNALYLALFCPNTLMTTSYKDFIDLLPTIELHEKFYLDSFNSYVNYLTNIILLNSLKEKKAILTYEQYFFNTLVGFLKSVKQEVDTKKIATLWIRVINIYKELQTIISKYEIISFEVNFKTYLPFPHNNSNVKKFSYNVNTLFTFGTKDGYVVSVILTPFSHDINLNLLALSEYYKNLKHVMYHITLNSNSTFKINYITTEQKVYTKLYNKFLVDFNKPSLTFCNFCRIKEICTNQYKIHGTLPITDFYKKSRKIKTLSLG